MLYSLVVRTSKTNVESDTNTEHERLVLLVPVSRPGECT
jgi:hypothetical protein